MNGMMLILIVPVCILLVLIPVGVFGQEMNGDELGVNELEMTFDEDLLEKGRMLLFLEVEAENSHRLDEITEIIQREENSELRDRRMRSAGMITLSTAVATLALFNVFWLMSDRQYERYNDAATLEEANSFKEKTQKYESLSYVFGTVGVVSLGVSIPLLSVHKNKNETVQIQRD